MNNVVMNRQIFFIIFYTLVGYTVIELPKTMAETSGSGAWVTIILSSVVFTLPVAIIAYLGNMFREKTLFEYSKLLAGKFITYIFAFIYIIYFFGVLSMICRLAAEIIKADFLPKTPIWAIVFMLVITSAYAASKGITNLGRIFVFLGIVILVMALVLHTVMFILGDIKSIRPFYDVSETARYLKGVPTTVLAFLGFEVLTVIPLTKQNGKKAIYYCAGAILAAGLFYTYIVESCYSIVGIDDIVNYKDALIVAIRRIDAPFLQFLKRLDIIFIFAWLMAIFCTLSILLYTLNEYSCKIFSRANKFHILTVVSILVFIVSLLPKSLDSASAILSSFAGYAGLIPAFLIPFILLIIAKVRKNVHKA